MDRLHRNIYYGGSYFDGLKVAIAVKLGNMLKV
jgi:hypothetical protein